MTEESRKKLLDAVTRLNAAHRNRAECMIDRSPDSDEFWTEWEQKIDEINREIREILS